MHDIKFIRSQPEAFDAALVRRGLDPQAKLILEKDAAHRALLHEAQTLQQQRNSLSKEIGTAKRAGNEALFKELSDKVTALKTDLPAKEAEAEALQTDLKDILSGLPNILHDDVPDGVGEEDNPELSRWGTPPSFNFTPLPHEDIGQNLGMMPTEVAVKLSGSRFTMLTGQLAQLERALGQFMLNQHTKVNGYTEVSPPYLVRSQAMYGTGQLPKFHEDAFSIEDKDLWLISTSEIALANIVADSITDTAALPLRFTALTPCFRSEAGSAGRDTAGLIRLHQFHKVELVSIVTEDNGAEELERQTACAEDLLQKLGLPYRKVLHCGGDIGFSAYKSYDLEVWMPAQNTYREICSSSWCHAFQARRMNARHKSAGEKETQFVHTLNCTGLAVGRTLAALLENYQTDNGLVDFDAIYAKLV